LALVDLEMAIGRLRYALAADTVLKSFAKFVAAYKANFDPNQPRVPAGNSEGGQWTSGAGAVPQAPAEASRAESVTVEGIVAIARRLNLVGSRADYRACVDLCYRLLERFQPRGTTNINYWASRDV
jgi:hypothetical protein